MIVKVLDNIVSRTLMQQRCLDLMAKRCMSTICKNGASTTRNPLVRVSSHSGLCTYGNIRENHKRLARLGSITSYHLPLRIPALSLFSGKAGKTEQDSLQKRDYATEENEENKLSIFKRFKNMYRDYWYVLVPVHVITSVGWYGGFYYLAKSGVDIMSVLETLRISDYIPDTLKDSKAGYLAVAYGLYKIATPLRYMVTIGITTVSIRYLKDYGCIKPIPRTEKLKEIYQEKKENFMERRQHLTDGIKQKREQFKERRERMKQEKERR